MKKKKLEIPYYIDRFKNKVSVSSKFTYELTSYEVTKYGAELHDTKFKDFNEFRGFKNCKMINKNNKRYMDCQDLISVPIEFITKNNFKLIKNE